MSDNTMTMDEFLAKIEWEGSIADALDYGLTTDDLTSQAREENAEFVALWDRAALQHIIARDAMNRIETLMTAKGWM